MEPVEGKMTRALNLARVLTRLHRIAELARPAGVRRSAAAQRNHAPEEPDAGIPHVRICGGPGRVTARVYPTPGGKKLPLIKENRYLKAIYCRLMIDN